MRHDTSTTADGHVELGSLWVDRAHHRRLVEVIHVPDEAPGPAAARARLHTGSRRAT